MDYEANIDWKSPELLSDTVKAYVSQDHPIVVIGGGDGTLSTCAKHSERRKYRLGNTPFRYNESFCQRHWDSTNDQRRSSDDCRRGTRICRSWICKWTNIHQ